MKTKLGPDTLTKLVEHFDTVRPEWGSRVHLDHFSGEVATLKLPADRITWDEKRLGFWPHVALLHGSLLLQINSFARETGPGNGWAIPFGKPASEMEQIQSELGFREGWEASRPETVLVLGAEWIPLMTLVLEHGVVCLGCEGHRNLFVMSFSERDLKLIAEFVGRGGKKKKKKR